MSAACHVIIRGLNLNGCANLMSCTPADHVDLFKGMGPRRETILQMRINPLEDGGMVMCPFVYGHT